MRRIITIALISISYLSITLKAQEIQDLSSISLNDTLKIQETLDLLNEKVKNDAGRAVPLLLLMKEKITKYPFSPSKELKWRYGINAGLMDAYKIQDKLGEAVLYGQKAIRNAEKLRMYPEAQGLRVKVGDMHYQLGDKLKSLNLYYQALNNWDGELPREFEPYAYFGIARVHFDQRSYEDAEKSLKEALKRLPDFELKAEILQYLGKVKSANEEYLQALEYYSKALALNEKLEKSDRLGENYRSIGIVFTKLGRFTKAENFFKLSLIEDEKSKNDAEIALTYTLLMELQNKIGDTEKALEYGLKAKELSQGNENLDLKEKLYTGLSSVYSSLDNAEKSLEYANQYSEVLKKRISQKQSEEINEFRVKYEMEKKERELEELNNQKRLSELAFQQKIADDRKEKNMLFAFGTLMFVIILMGAVLLFNYQRQIDANKTITQKNEEINRVKIKELEKSLRLESANAMLKGQEIERNRIAKDLHDSVGALLSSIKLHFQSIKKHVIDPRGAQVYEKTNQLIDDACFEVRNISHDMMPGSLIRFGLIPALQDYTSKLKSSQKLSVDLVNYGVPEELDDSVSLNAYRIVQELLNNVIKHSEAREVLVQLTMKGDKMNIMVEDDGKGFDPDLAKEKGIGLKNIISRVNYLNGKIHFDSEEGKGSNIMIDFPIAS